MTLKKSATPVRKIKQATKNTSQSLFFSLWFSNLLYKVWANNNEKAFSFHGVRFYKSSNFEEDHLGQVTSCIKLQAVCG